MCLSVTSPVPNASSQHRDWFGVLVSRNYTFGVKFFDIEDLLFEVIYLFVLFKVLSVLFSNRLSDMIFVF